MTLHEVLVVTAVAVLGANIGLLLISAGHHVVATVRTRHRDAVRAELRPLLIRLVTDEEATLPPVPRRRTAALEVLAVDLLGKVRGEARDALLAVLDQAGAPQQAVRRLRRPGPVGRSAAAELLGRAGRAEHLPALVARLDDRDPEVRAVACRALGRIGEPSAVPHLLAALDSRRPVPMGIVGSSLLRIGPVGTGPLRDALQGGRSSTAARALAVEVLGLHGALEAAGVLATRLQDRDEELEVRIRAARALGRIGSPRGTAALSAVVTDDEPTGLRAVAARALGEIGGDDAAAVLLPLLDDPAHVVASNAATALPRCGARGRALLLRRAGGEGRGAALAREALALADLWVHRTGPAEAVS
ncbi:HEAT repeat domain-containing protein [Iamia sp. SCSIO 61187]|uniref:HEAT repeat domain-containing protein n=1 Tax=Iamia sp. SCSIO 61187 TaxID=2722752 RepID=UPI001C628695|nr:HEAT repeat domain-containing protein [Iamia sp. SCSIO 61187]QYG93810.1 HEAT repeat domain-containing protein [Iamia sp. SCSIO 61187]